MRIKVSAALLSVMTIFSVTAPAQAGSIFDIGQGQDPRYMCNTLLGRDEQSSAIAMDNSVKRSDTFHSENSSEHNSFSSSSSEKGGKSGFLGLGGGGKFKNARENKNSSIDKSMLKTDSAYEENKIFSQEQTSSTTVAFENADCSNFVEAAATVEVAEIEAEVNHAAIEAKQQKSYYDMLMQEEW